VPAYTARTIEGNSIKQAATFYTNSGYVALRNPQSLALKVREFIWQKSLCMQVKTQVRSKLQIFNNAILQLHMRMG
jgi:hypothetical protein